MKYFRKIINYLKDIRKKLGSPLFGLLLNIFMLGVAIYALIIAQKTLDNANEQFRINSITSDSLFNFQLGYSKILNDSLISQVSSLQKITNKQLQITNEQLEVSREIYEDQLYSGRPIIVVKEYTISDTAFIQGDVFSPMITSIIENVGKRSAIDLVFRPYIVYPDYSAFRSSTFHSISIIIEPDAQHAHDYKPKIDRKFKYDFFYCFEITFYDNILDKPFKQYYYQHYKRNRNAYDFYECREDEKEKIKNFLKVALKSINEPAFDE